MVDYFQLESNKQARTKFYYFVTSLMMKNGVSFVSN